MSPYVDIILVSRDGLKSDIMRVTAEHLHSGMVTAIPPKIRTLYEYPEDTPLKIDRRFYMYEGRRDRDREIYYLDEQV